MPISTLPVVRRIILRLLMLAGLFAAFVTLAADVAAQEPQWIWSPAQKSEEVPVGTCYFRKAFEMGHPASGEIQITCDNAYELYINGRRVAAGENWRQLDVHDITKFLQTGRNVVAVKAMNTEDANAGLAVRLVVQSQGGAQISHRSDKSWKTGLTETPNWARPTLNDSSWLAAQEIGPLNKTKPWYDQVLLAGGGASTRFQTSREFEVHTVVESSETGSLLTMAFNEFGHLLAAREGGPLLLIKDTNGDKVPDQVGEFSEHVKNIQGILPLNGQVFVIGESGGRSGMFRLSDKDSDGKADLSEMILEFGGKMGEHGAHSPVLGPDGLIYIMLGNHSTVKKEADPASPYKNYYEGDLVGPRYEDPGGHAAGIKAPGGMVIRTDADGSFVETVAGGFRNAYDMAFNSHGELMTVDSDMEWDEGMTWYRPTRVNHIIPGGEYGWRSGWSVWPDYYLDSLPSTLDLGRGSPAGMAVYDHFMYPVRLHNALFMADWSRGQIVAVRMKLSGGSYKAQAETFVAGKPLNATDVAIGPDGNLYFCTGGRGTEGGIFRVTWKGRVPPAITNIGEGLESALRQPQFNSAYARQNIARVKAALGPKWDSEITAAVENAQLKPEQRVRALNVMHLIGPFPTAELLIKLSKDPEPVVRAKAAALMGIHADEDTGAALVKLLRDKDGFVARSACEALVRAGQKPPVTHLAGLLASPDPYVAWAARRALEQVSADSWKDLINGSNHRVMLQASMALMAVDPTHDNAMLIVQQASEAMKGFMSDEDFLDLLRLVQVAMHRGELTAADVPEFTQQLANEYPSADVKMNRELVKLLVHLQAVEIADRLLEQLTSDIPMPEKVHAALHARYLNGWTTAQKLELVKFLELARAQTGGGSYVGYIENVSRDFFATWTEDELLKVLAQGAKWPSSALSALAKLPPQVDVAVLEQLQQLDREVSGLDGEPARRLGIGIVAVLGRSGNADAMRYLREVYENSPDRRSYIAISLAQNPGGENFQLLVDSLSTLEGIFAQEVLSKLATVDQVPEEPEALRQVILRGLKLGNNGGKLALPLLEKWTETKIHAPDDTVPDALAKWQAWFATTFPEMPEAVLPTDSADNKWTYDELLTHLSNTQNEPGDIRRGEVAFAKAQCVKCHRYGSAGETIGPDLTTISKRFQKKEILESILFPSHVISDQYASKNILTTDGKIYTGITGPQGGDTLVVLQSDGEKVSIPSDEIEEITPSKVSAMPAGLLNTLTLDEITDLFTYLEATPRAVVTRRPGSPLRN